MNLPLEPEGPPLTQNEQGVWRVTGTRVSVKSLLYGHLQGESAEEIHEQFPTVPLDVVHRLIGWYSRHRAIIDEYLRESQEREDRILQELRASSPQADLRERIAAYRKRLAS